MADTFFFEGLNTLPEQVQINKEDIKKLSDSSNTQTEQLQALTTKVDTNTANIATNTSNIATNNTNIDNLSNKVYDNGTISFYLDSNLFIFKDQKTGSYFYIHLNNPNEWLLGHSDIFSFDCSEVFINRGKLNINGDIYTNSLYIHNIQITKISNSNATDSHSLLTGKAINDTFLTKTDASNTYLTKTDASNTYVTIQDYEERIDTGDITLTQNGFDKISTMTEDVGTTITLTDTTDFTEHIQVTNTRELILNVNYNGDPIYRNIHLMPNQTIDDYTAVQDGTENWYTGHAILILPSQDDGYFAVSYQNGNHSQLILTLIAHY